MANIMDEILEQLIGIRTLLEVGGTPATASKPEPKAEKPKAEKPKAKKPSGPTLEDVQNKIREMVAANEDSKSAISDAIKKLGGKRAGDFEGDDAKLDKLMTALNGIGSEEVEEDNDDDLL